MPDYEAHALKQIPSKYHAYLDIAEVPDEITDWRGDPPMLTLYGKNGVGKTTVAARLARDVSVHLTCSIMWINCATLRARLGAEVRDEQSGPSLIDKAQDVRLLVLDDLDAARQTEHVMDTVRGILCHRYDFMLPTIVTMDDTTMLDREPRLASRLSEGLVITVNGSDRRRSGHSNIRVQV